MPGGDNAMLMRFGGSAPPAAIVTFGLFFLMQVLVATGNTKLDKTEVIILPDWGGVPEEQTVQRKKREAEKPEELDTPPSLDPQPPVVVGRGPGGFAIPTEPANPDLGPRTGLGAARDGAYLPLVRVEPRYPRREAERGIEGETVVEFTITETGMTADCIVVSQEPAFSSFGTAACRAIAKWRYRPRIVDGEALPVVGVQTLLTFKLADE